MIRSMLNRFIKPTGPKLNYVFITDKVVPVFHDMHKLSNKKINFKEDPLDVNEAFLERQADNIILATDDLSYNSGDSDFQVNGIKMGQCYEITNLGYLGNLNELCEVKLVTDNYVFFKDTSGSVVAYSHEEINRIRNNNSLIILN